MPGESSSGKILSQGVVAGRLANKGSPPPGSCQRHKEPSDQADTQQPSPGQEQAARAQSVCRCPSRLGGPPLGRCGAETAGRERCWRPWYLAVCRRRPCGWQQRTPPPQWCTRPMAGRGCPGRGLRCRPGELFRLGAAITLGITCLFLHPPSW